MADVHSIEQRSYNMSKIRARDTKPEVEVRRFLHKAGFRYRLHVKDLPGKPDIVLKKYKSVVFIHGCFWHGHVHCRYYVIPKTRTEWWLNKIQTNIVNDTKAETSLKKEGWKVIIIWECQLKKQEKEKTLQSLIKKIKS